MGEIILFLRAWHGRALGIALLTSGAFLLLLSPDAVEILGRQGVRFVIWPIVPAIYAAALSIAASAGYRELELAAARNSRTLRLQFLGYAILGIATLTLLGFRFEPGIVFRNAAALAGLALASTVLLPRALAWPPPLIVPIGMWLFGPREIGEVSSWAVFLQPVDSGPAASVSLGLFIIGTAAYVFIDRPTR